MLEPIKDILNDKPPLENSKGILNGVPYQLEEKRTGILLKFEHGNRDVHFTNIEEAKRYIRIHQI